MTSVYYKYSHGAIVTFDLARRETFLAGLAWLADYTAAMELEGEEAAPVVMVGNKSDCDTGDQVSVGYKHTMVPAAVSAPHLCLDWRRSRHTYPLPAPPRVSHSVQCQCRE